MVTYETIEQHETEFGNNNFLQVARKVAKDDNGSTEFISVTRGYIDGQGSKRYKNQISLPTDPDVVGFVAEALKKV